MKNKEQDCEQQTENRAEEHERAQVIERLLLFTFSDVLRDDRRATSAKHHPEAHHERKERIDNIERRECIDRNELRNEHPIDHRIDGREEHHTHGRQRIFQQSPRTEVLSDLIFNHITDPLRTEKRTLAPDHPDAHSMLTHSTR